MLKILHTADIHLGAKFSGLGEKGVSQREQLRTTFKNVIATAIAERVNIVLIAGDLFDSNQQPQKNIDLVIEQLNLLGSNNIPVCLIPGTHDSLDSSSVYRKVDFEGKCSNLKVFTDENVSCKEYPSLDLTVYGKPNLSNRSSMSPLKGLRRSTSSKLHIAMAHGSLYIPEKTAQDDHVFRLEEVEAAGMDYLALGHWHRVYRCPAGRQAWYSGPPEWISGQTEKGGVLLVSLSDGGEVKVDPKMLGLRDYGEVEIDVGEVQDLPMLKARISEGANQNLVRKVTLRGLRDAELIVNAEELEGELGEKFLHLSVMDRSHPKSEEVTEDEERLIRNGFIRLMKRQIQSSEGEQREIAESALQYGVALLDGKLDAKEDL
ncbi:MAG: DNA repair exonuclease [Dehalococcoidia bacterium]|nr:DNA repair exonuclease [Dehalococcoidia bacterium]MDH4368157.1 DNA repair exonuclease [Dehalococcoidia bacterium]